MNATSPVLAASPFLAPQFAPTSRPPPTKRVIEAVDSASSSKVKADDPQSEAADDLSRSAKRFASLLQATGDVRVSAYLSGLPLGVIDTYA